MNSERESVTSITVPTSWSLKKVGQLADLTAGGTPSTNVPEYWDGDIPWMSSGEVNLGRITAVEGRITELGFRNSSTKMIPVHSVMMALAGQGKTRGKVAYNEIELCTNQSLAAIMPRKDLDYKFLFYNLESRYDEIRAMSSGDGGRGGLNLTIIKSIQLLLPPFAEQQKIAEILSTVDEKMAVIDEQLAQTQELKKGLMQRLLTKGIGHTAFKDSPLGQIPESWVVTKIKDATTAYSGGTPKRNVDGYYNGNIPWVKSGEVNQRNITSTEETVTEKALKESATRLIKPGSILIALYGATAGNVGMLRIEACSNQAVLAVNSKISSLSNEFLLYYLKLTTSSLLKMTQGSGQPNLSKGIIDSIIFPLPPIGEQHQIVEVLATIDDKLQVLIDKKTQYQELKRGLMQQLLTGQRRVNLPELAIA